MSTAISTRLVLLRTEKGLSQKNAAQALGVSQGLLSHYEKGIRECGLDFLCRASAFYDVSTDYLLGLTEAKYIPDTLYSQSDMMQDSEIHTSTIFRATVFLAEKMNKSGKNFSDSIISLYVLMLYRIYSCALNNGIVPPSANKGSGNLAYFSSGVTEHILSQIYMTHPETKSKKSEKLPLCIETVLSEATRLIKNDMENSLK